MASKQQKTVKVIARIQWKSDPRKVVYLNRSSDGVSQYETSLFDGKATSCSCPSRKPCKHMKHSEQVEQERKVVESPEQKEEREWSEYRRELARKLARQFMTTQVVEQIVEQQNVEMPPIAMELPPELKGYRKKAVSVDISTKGNLNGQQGFSLLKRAV